MIAPCPFCQSRRALPRESAFRRQWRVECPDCGASGPASGDSKIAAICWNLSALNAARPHRHFNEEASTSAKEPGNMD